LKVMFDRGEKKKKERIGQFFGLGEVSPRPFYLNAKREGGGKKKKGEKERETPCSDKPALAHSPTSPEEKKKKGGPVRRGERPECQSPG